MLGYLLRCGLTNLGQPLNVNSDIAIVPFDPFLIGARLMTPFGSGTAGPLVEERMQMNGLTDNEEESS